MSTELRDRFFALSSRTASADDVARFHTEVDAIDVEAVAVIDGLGVSWHPTVRFKAVRFVDAERIDARVRGLFARPSEDAPYLAAVFVDPRELSFRTFENIVPLDRIFADAPPEFELSQPVEFAEGAYTAQLRLGEADRMRLESLDGLNLYVPPLNSDSRGGERFIFHSALLADALTTAVSRALPESVLDGFAHVNPVFRANRFEPGDANFHAHRDTPYYDAARGLASRHTLLLYLTGGTGDPALDLAGGAALTEIEAFTCVIFDQRYEHEGAPYDTGRKVFLRTELIFHQAESEVEHVDGIGALFGKACYLTGESVFAPELARHADAYYNQVAAARFLGTPPDAAEKEPFLHKRFRGVDFVSNGYDFWFAKDSGPSLVECAAITLLDYFNCKLGDAAFRDLCESSVVHAHGTDWIPGFLADARSAEQSAASGMAPEFDKSLFFPESEEANGACCPFHSWGEFDATRFDEIIELNESAQTFAKAHIMPAPILMLGQDVVLDPGWFVVRGNQIHVLGNEALTPVNFAACWNSGGMPQNYIDVAATVGAAHFLVPPILFTETDDCHHLQFDFFRNTWMVRHGQLQVPIPRIRNADEMNFDPDDWDSAVEDSEAYPWFDAADEMLQPWQDSEQRMAGLWWIDGDPVTDELRELLVEMAEDYDDEDDEDA